jgi:hypothetical protein
MIRLAVAFVLAVAATAVLAGAGATGCTLSTTPSDAGSDAGSQTVGEQCAMIATALCNAYPMCAQDEPDNCIENFNSGCCSGTICDDTSGTSADAVQECVAAYTPPDCNALQNAVTPAACSGIPQAP